MEHDTPAPEDPPQRLTTDDSLEAALAVDLTHNLLAFLRDWVTPIVDWVQSQGGDPHDVFVAIVETLRALADGLEDGAVQRESNPPRA